MWVTFYSKIEKTAHRFGQLKEQHDMLNYELNNLKQRLAQTSFQQTKEEIEELNKKIGKWRVIFATNCLKLKLEILIFVLLYSFKYYSKHLNLFFLPYG